MLPAATRLGPYELVAVLGAGGMGEVYRARDTRLGREVAVKVLPAAFAHDKDRLTRFEREARAIAALSHPNILAIHDFGTQDGITYAVMELLEGETLRARLARGPLAWREAAAIGAAIAEGLAAAHAKGIIHRDLKPDNLFLTDDGRVKILDFGLARVTPPPEARDETSPYEPAGTNPGTVMGTVGYMAPEQVRARPVDAACDLFAFGCVLYEMVTGQRAFQRETAAETLTAILREEPPDPLELGIELPGELKRLLGQCLAKNPVQRLHSARDVALALRAIASLSHPTLPRTPQARGDRPAVRAPRLPADVPSIPLADAATRSHLPQRRRALLLVLALGLAALTVGLAVATHRLLRGQPTPSIDRQALNDEASARQTRMNAIAVLAFENQSTDPGAEYLGDDITFSLTESLSRYRDLKVRPYSSASRFKDKAKSPAQAGKELQVDAVLTGTLQRRGDDVVIFVELVDVRNDQPLWRQRFEGTFADRLALQQRIVRGVPERLHLELTKRESEAAARLATQNLRAHELYVRGRLEWTKRTPPALAKAREYFQQAVEADPNYAAAHAGLADALLIGAHGVHVSGDVVEEARRIVARALELDPRLGEALATSAMIKSVHDWDWKGAEAAFREAIQVQPNYATAHHWFSRHWLAVGRYEDALAEARLALDLDPEAPMIGVNLFWPLMQLGRHEEAVKHLEGRFPQDKGIAWAHLALALAYGEQGRQEAALRELNAALAIEEVPAGLAEAAFLYVKFGRRDEAERMLHRLHDLNLRFTVPASAFARAYAGMGAHDQALDYLEKALEQRDPNLHVLRPLPSFRALRGHPRFLAVVRRMHLPEEAAPTSGFDR